MTEKTGKKRNRTDAENEKKNRNNDDFIMLPTVDFCFKELMKNDKVRKGFVAALLGRDPETIRQTTLIPNELRKESEDEKLGILDVLVDFPKDQRCYRKIILCDAETGEPYTDLIELHILELKKLPPEDQNETGFIRRISFLNGKSRKELK